MNGFCGVIGTQGVVLDQKDLLDSINLDKTMKVNTISGEDYFFAVSYLVKSPLKGERIQSTKDRIWLFAGDLIDFESIPWEEIERQFLKNNFEWFSTLKGYFALAICDVKRKMMTLISDYFSYYPIYYGKVSHSFVFSTDLSSFSMLNPVPKFNIEWLYEYLYFNFPIFTTTFFKDISRLTPFTILKYDTTSSEISFCQYSQYFNTSDHLIKGKEALNKMSNAFKEIIPKYYSRNNENLVAISGGFDSRTILSLAPGFDHLKTYTYGVEGCNDDCEVQQMMDKFSIDHTKISFGNDFTKLLPKLIKETVRVSGGVQPILRSTLLYVYKKLSKEVDEASTVLGGINGDFFRGWNLESANASISSKGMKYYYKTGEIVFEEEMCSKMFGKDIVNFKKHIKQSFQIIEKIYGIARHPASKMLFTAFQVNPRYFGGEMSIASNYFIFRQPYYDAELMQLAFDTECGHLGFSERRNANGDTKYKQYVLQSQVIYSNPAFKKTRIKGVPLILMALDNKWIYQLFRPVVRSFDYLTGYQKPKNDLEEWEDWFGNVLKETFDEILNEHSLILNYIEKDFMLDTKKSANIHLMSKLVTTEIILNLMNQKWEFKS